MQNELTVAGAGRGSRRVMPARAVGLGAAVALVVGLMASQVDVAHGPNGDQSAKLIKIEETGAGLPESPPPSN